MLTDISELVDIRCSLMSGTRNFEKMKQFSNDSLLLLEGVNFAVNVSKRLTFIEQLRNLVITKPMFREDNTSMKCKINREIVQVLAVACRKVLEEYNGAFDNVELLYIVLMFQNIAPTLYDSINSITNSSGKPIEGKPSNPSFLNSVQHYSLRSIHHGIYSLTVEDETKSVMMSQVYINTHAYTCIH